MEVCAQVFEHFLVVHETLIFELEVDQIVLEGRATENALVLPLELRHGDIRVRYHPFELLDQQLGLDFGREQGGDELQALAVLCWKFEKAVGVVMREKGCMLVLNGDKFLLLVESVIESAVYFVEEVGQEIVRSDQLRK